MAMRKLVRDHAKAEVATITGLLDQLGLEDAMMRFSLQDRLDELHDQIADWDDEPPLTAASAALFFGGRPVAGSRGIESEFGASAVSKFQDIVAKVLARSTSGGLGQRGVVPNKAASILHITNVVRGSFGFMLEEIESQEHLLDTSLKGAVENATELLDAFGEPDEEKFRSAVEGIDERVLGTAREFFVLMKQSGATLRLVTGDEDHSFGMDAVARAADRATSTVLEEEPAQLIGQLLGTLPDSHQFEFRTGESGEVIRGSVDRIIPTERLVEMNRQWTYRDAIASFTVKRVIRSGVIVRESFTLMDLFDDPENIETP